MLSEESEKISLENRFKETIKKANKVKEYIRERDKERGYSSEPSIAECLAYDMKYVEEYITKLQKENENLIKEKEENKFLIAMANNGMLEYNQGYSDGKNQNSNATEIIIKNRQAYIHKEEVEFLQRKIEKYKYLYQKALDNTVKTDKENIDLKKQIDLMAEEIRNTILIVKPESKFCQYEEDCKNIRCKDCIKQFFEKQAKEI